MTYLELNELAKTYGPSFYLLDTQKFCKNFKDLTEAFRIYYPNMNIAYSYKTNYIPRLCSLVDKMGGYAEVVSHMEYEITKKLGIRIDRVVFNGPYKDAGTVEELVLGGGIVNLDSLTDLELVKALAEKYPDQLLKVGIRCNFDIGDNVTSRFGFDVEGHDFQKTLAFFRETENVALKGLHCHFASRGLKTWSPRITGMLNLIDKMGVAEQLEYVDLGGGLFGKMPDSLKEQFDSLIPTYEEYAQTVAKPFSEFYAARKHRPLLLIEPGSALAGDVMSFAAPVISIKDVRGKKIATVLGSIYNINPTLNKKNPPLQVYFASKSEQQKDLDFGGFTCIESDYLYRHYNGPLAKGDYVVFGNVGSYSVVLKPPFILPNFPVLERDVDGTVSVVKREESFKDLFHTYQF